VLAYLIEQNRVLRKRVGGRRLRLSDDDRRKRAARAYRLGRGALREVGTIGTPDTLLRWPSASHTARLPDIWEAGSTKD
jgi:hypothetical protein